MAIDTIIFDFGGVLYHTPDMKGLKRWQKLLGFKNDPVVSAFIADPTNSQMFWDVMVGKVEEREIWDLLAKKWKIPSRLLSRFRQSMMSKRRLNKSLAQYLGNLRQSYKTAILSNAGNETRYIMEDILGLDNYVDEIIISAEEGFAKPDHTLYEIAISRLKTTAEECVFVDDLIVNIEAAQELGMETIHYKDNGQVIAHLEKILGRGTLS